MNMSKKVVSALLAGCMVATFAACGGTEKPANGASAAGTDSSAAETPEVSAAEGSGDLQGKSITFTMQKYGSDASAQEKVLKEMTEAFKAETGITVNYSIIDWGQALTKLTLACTGGEAPDVADIFFTPSMAKIGNGQYGPADVTAVFEELGGEDAYFDSILDEVRIDGKVYGIPWRMDTRCLVYNKAHFEEAGITAPPKTYDELVEVAKKLTQTDANGNITRSGIVFGGDARFDQAWFSLLAGHGTSVMNDAYNEFTFNSEAGTQATQFMYDLINKYQVTTKNVIDPSFNSGTEFQAEKASMVWGQNADFMTAIEANAPQLKDVTMSAVMPNLTGEGVSSIAFTAPISIMNTTPERAAAEEWLKYFCSTEGQIKFCSAVNLINARKDVMEDEFYSGEWMKAFPEQANRSIYGDPAIPTWSQIDAFPNGPLNSMLTNIIGGADIQKEMGACEEKVQAIYDKNEVALS